jgi:hypothetical protein
MPPLIKFAPGYFSVALLALATATVSYAHDLSTKTLALPTFTAISLETVGDLIVENDLKHDFTIEAEPKVIALISAKVEGNVLHIFATGDFKTEKSINLKVRLSKLNEISSRSSGDILLGKFKTDKLGLLVDGSGSITATKIYAEKVTAKIAGSGDIDLGGQVSTLQAEINGTGTIEASKLITSSATASIGGSGDINLHVTNLLKASIDGSGTISYRGNPKLTSSISGAGDIVKQE